VLLSLFLPLCLSASLRLGLGDRGTGWGVVGRLVGRLVLGWDWDWIGEVMDWTDWTGRTFINSLTWRFCRRASSSRDSAAVRLSGVSVWIDLFGFIALAYPVSMMLVCWGVVGGGVGGGVGVWVYLANTLLDGNRRR
jgi:hypothetical protein